MDERFTQIEKDNLRLIKKMSNIMKSGSYSDIFSSNPRESRNNIKSLNKNVRKQELVKITIENQRILKRLKEKQPNINVIKMEEERIK